MKINSVSLKGSLIPVGNSDQAVGFDKDKETPRTSHIISLLPGKKFILI